MKTVARLFSILMFLVGWGFMAYSPFSSLPISEGSKTGPWALSGITLALGGLILCMVTFIPMENKE